MTAPGQGPVAPLDLPVGGMTCAACVAHVDQALRKAPFVQAVSVNLITRAASVTLAPEALLPERKAATLAQLVQAVEQAGYHAHLPDDQQDVLAAQQAADQALAEESRDRARRAGVALAAAVLAMVLSMPLMHGAHGAHDPIARRLMAWLDPPLAALWPGLYAAPPDRLMGVLLAVFTPILVWVVGPIARRAWAAARVGTTDMNTLIALGAAASLASSLLGDVAIDAALFIVGFVLLGQALEGRARGRTSLALSALASLQAEVAHRELDDGTLVDLSPKELRVGDRILVRPGERFPGDGRVLEGEGPALEAILTGESRPVDKRPGSTVLGGTVNGDQPLSVELVRLGEGSTLHQLLRLLREAQARRAPTQRLADRASAIFVPSMIGLALLTFLLWWGLDGLEAAARHAVAVLVVACPCAMGLAVPTAVVVATGKAARGGVLVKGGDILERLAKIQTVVFDKTGTLTEGRPSVTRVVSLDPGTPEVEVLAWAAALERGSGHPLAQAIIAEAEARGAPRRRVKSPRAEAGAGLIGVAEDQPVAIGNRRILAIAALAPTEQARAEAAVPGPEAPLFVIRGAQVLGYLSTADRPREDAARTIAALRAQGIGVRVSTGDHRAAALVVAEALGIPADAVEADVLPADKVKAVEAQQALGPTAFVGDGVNDAAALAVAEVGVGIGGGSDVAVAAADVALLSPKLSALPSLFELARRTRRVMLQNLGWAFGYNLLMLPLAVGLFAPFGLHLSPVLAAVAMSLSSVTVVMNSLRLARVPFSP